MNSAEAVQSRKGVFPPVSDGLYLGRWPDPGTTQQSRGEEVLSLSSNPPPFWRRFWPFVVSPKERLAQLVYTHRMAFEAERCSRHARADFYWLEFDRLFARTWQQEDVWRRETGEPAAELREAFAREIALAVHLDFCSAIEKAEKDEVTERILKHLRFAGRIVDTCGLGSEELKVALHWHAQRLMEREKYSEALKLTTDLDRRWPGEPKLQELHIAAIHRASLSAAEKEGNEAGAHTLEEAISSLHALRSREDAHPAVYQTLGVQYAHLAMKHAASKKLTEAFLATEKATVCYPELNGLAELRCQLVALTESLKAQIDQAEAKIRWNPNAGLSVEGKRLKHEVQTAFQSALSWQHSSEASDWMREKAETWQRWREPEPQEDPKRRTTSLTMDKPATDGDKEKLTDWVGSLGAWHFRLQVVLAVMLMVVGLGLLVVKDRVHRARELAWAELQQATSVADDDRTIVAAERFLSSREEGSEDEARLETAKEWYSLALVRWYSRLPGEPGREAIKRVERYGRLVGKGTE